MSKAAKKNKRQRKLETKRPKKVSHKRQSKRSGGKARPNKAGKGGQANRKKQGSKSRQAGKSGGGARNKKPRGRTNAQKSGHSRKMAARTRRQRRTVRRKKTAEARLLRAQERLEKAQYALKRAEDAEEFAREWMDEEKKAIDRLRRQNDAVRDEYEAERKEAHKAIELMKTEAISERAKEQNLREKAERAYGSNRKQYAPIYAQRAKKHGDKASELHRQMWELKVRMKTSFRQAMSKIVEIDTEVYQQAWVAHNSSLEILELAQREVDAAAKEERAARQALKEVARKQRK